MGGDGQAAGLTAAGAAKAKAAAYGLAALDTQVKNAALEKIASGLLIAKAEISRVNALDVERARRDNLPAPLVKRLVMDEKKVESAATGIRNLAALPDPVGRRLLETELDDGLILRRVSCPIGVVGVIFESRPDALIQIACLCLKSGNAVMLKGGAEAFETNRLLTSIIRDAAAGAGIPDGWIYQLETRSEIKEMLGMDDRIDLLIPRGSYEFVRYVMDNSRIPVLGHSEGICHCYVDATADIGLAIKVVVDSKTQYVAVCNAVETLLVHKAAAPAFLPALWEAFNGGRCAGEPENDIRTDGRDAGTDGSFISADGRDAGAAGKYVDANGCDSGRHDDSAVFVTIKGCAETARILSGRPVEPATEDDWRAEYLDYTLAVKIVGSIDEAIGHINKYGSAHTDAILTEDADAAAEFMLRVDSANVFHNCSTRFSDGFRYGFGAEVGVSTSKIHARGPVGLDGLVTYKYLLSGHGQTAAEYESGERRFTHKPINP